MLEVQHDFDLIPDVMAAIGELNIPTLSSSLIREKNQVHHFASRNESFENLRRKVRSVFHPFCRIATSYDVSIFFKGAEPQNTDSKLA